MQLCKEDEQKHTGAASRVATSKIVHEKALAKMRAPTDNRIRTRNTVPHLLRCVRHKKKTLQTRTSLQKARALKPTRYDESYRNSFQSSALYEILDEKMFAEWCVSLNHGIRVGIVYLVDFGFKCIWSHAFYDQPLVVLFPLPAYKIANSDRQVCTV